MIETKIKIILFLYTLFNKLDLYLYINTYMMRISLCIKYLLQGAFIFVSIVKYLKLFE